MKCSSCNASIMFAWGVKRPGKPQSRIPLDLEPSPRGNVRVTGTGRYQKAEVLSGLFLEAARAADGDLHISHFATCPNAHRHRRTV